MLLFVFVIILSIIVVNIRKTVNRLRKRFTHEVMTYHLNELTQLLHDPSFSRAPSNLDVSDNIEAETSFNENVIDLEPSSSNPFEDPPIQQNNIQLNNENRGLVLRLFDAFRITDVIAPS